MLINDNYIPIAWGITYFIVPKFNISLLILMTQVKEKLSICCRDRFWDPTLQTHHQNIPVLFETKGWLLF